MQFNSCQSELDSLLTKYEDLFNTPFDQTKFLRLIDTVQSQIKECKKLKDDKSRAMKVYHHYIGTLPMRKGQPLYKGHFPYPQWCILPYGVNTFQLPKRGQPPYKGQNGWSQRVLYSEVPLYSYCYCLFLLFIAVVIVIIIVYCCCLLLLLFIAVIVIIIVYCCCLF